MQSTLEPEYEGCWRREAAYCHPSSAHPGYTTANTPFGCGLQEGCSQARVVTSVWLQLNGVQKHADGHETLQAICHVKEAGMVSRQLAQLTSCSIDIPCVFFCQNSCASVSELCSIGSLPVIESTGGSTSGSISSAAAAAAEPGPFADAMSLLLLLMACSSFVLSGCWLHCSLSSVQAYFHCPASHSIHTMSANPQGTEQRPVWHITESGRRPNRYH